MQFFHSILRFYIFIPYFCTLAYTRERETNRNYITIYSKFISIMTKTITERSRRSRWLLLALFAFLAGGVSPTWAQMTVLSEGFESNSLATNGWTNSTTSSSVITSGGRTGSYAFYFNYTTSTDQYLVSKDLSIPSTASNVNLSFYWKGRSTSYNEVFRVGYSTTTNSIDAFTWDDDTQSNKTTSWTEYTKALDANVKYIAIYYPKNNNWGLYIDDINLTCTVSGPAMSVLDGTSAISSGYNYSFGLATAGTAKTFTLKNEGTEACPVSVAHTGSFGAELSATSIPADGEVTLTVTMPATSDDDVITVSSTAEGIDDFIINVSGTVKDPSKIWCDFTSGVPTGWTNGGLTVSTSGAGTGTTGGGYIYDSGYNYSLTTPLLTFDGSEKMLFVAARTQSSASYCGLTVEYSANGTSWTSLTVPAVADIAYYYNNSWTPIELSGIPAGDYFIKFTLKYLRITDIYGGTESTAPIIALSQNSYDFGLIDENKASEAITITNTGKSALTGLNIISNNANFTVNCEATEIAADGGTATFTVTMAHNATGAQSATITVKSSNADDLVFTATGAVAKEGTTTAVFNDATLAGWTKAGNTSFDSDETAAYFYYSTNTLASPKVNIASDDFLAVEAKMASSYGYVTVEGSTDGTSFTEIKKLDNNVLNQTDYTTAIVSGISTDYKYLRLNGYYCYVKQVAGLNYAAVLVVKDAEEAAQTSGLTYPFGEVGANQTVSYTFNNAGAGTINITNVVSSNEVFTTNFDPENKPAVTSAEPFTLTITANYDAANAGEQNGTVTVTTSEGEFVINLTSTFLAANAPKMDFYIGEATEASTTGASLGFGIITADANKSIKIQNDGTGALNITSIALPDEDYTTDLEAAPTSETPLVIAAGSSKTIVFTLAANGKAIKTGKTITISAEGMEDFSFSADAYVLKDCETVNFADGVPSTWTNGGWSVDATTNKDIYANTSSKPYLTTPKMSFTANDFIIVNAKKYDNDNGDYIQIQYSTDNGANWTNLQKLDDSTLPTRDAGYSDIVVSNIPEGTNKLRFQGYYARIKTIAGLTYDDNDPKMGIYTDADCTVAATTTETKNFEFATETQTATYYIKNIGTGTMTLALGDQPAGFTQALDKTSVAAGEKATLTITMPAETKGYRNGTVTVNATDLGAFTVAVSGVMVDENKLNVDFTTANIPSTWTTNNWSKNANGYIETTGYSSTSLETVNLTAEAGETLVVVAKNTYSSSSYTFGVKYKKADSEEWSDLIAAANLGTAWKALTATIEEAGDYLLQFNGYYAQIQHIYGLTEPTEPVMVVYDGESVAAATYNFGNVANDADAEWTLTVKNEGKAVLEGLAAALSGEQAAHYSVNVTGLTDGNLAANATATITVKQLKDNLGAHTATLTISATSEGIADKVITLSGTTRDASKMYVDFADGNMPANWTVGTSWTVTSGYAQQTNYSTASALVTTPLTVAENEILTFEAARYSNYSAAELKARYSVDGGVTWSEYVDYASQITSSSFVALELTDVPAGTAVIEFYGRYVKLDNIFGFTPTTAPLLALTTSESVNGEGKYDFGQALQAAPADKVFTITNNGNADLVSDIAANDDVEIALSGNGVTIDGSQVTVPAGKSATLTVSLKFDAANPGAKSGSVTIDSNDPVADVVLNFTANVLDATAVNIDFANNSKPEGFYSNGWTYTSGYAANTGATEAELITSKLTVAGPSDVLSYQACTYNKSWYDGSLTVQYSTDRKNWTDVAPQPSDLNDNYQTFTVSGLKGGDYYLRFAGARVYVDNITGWHYATPAAEHDIYIANTTMAEATLLPGAEYTAKINVASLRADETDLTAAIYIQKDGSDYVEVGKITDQTLNLADGTKEFTITGTLPTEEGTYWLKANIWNDETSDEIGYPTVTIAHTRTLSITEFTREGEGNVDADENNQFDAAFNVTVQNTGSTAATPVVKIFVGETEVGTATADAEVAAGESKVIAVSVTDASAGEGGELLFTAKAYWTAEGEALATSASNIAIIVNAAAPKFALYQDATPVNDGDDVQFGLVKGDTWKTFEYSIKNEGNAPLVIKDVTVPAGFSYSDGALQNLYLYFYSDGTYNGDVAQFKYESENTVVARNVEVAKQGINFGVHEKDNWTNIYGWDGSAVESIGTAVSLADGQTTANGWLNIPVGTYDVTWNTNDNTIKFDYQGIPAGESMTFWVSLQPEQGKVSGNLEISYKVDATTDNTFTLALSGRSVSEDTWTVDFEDGQIPADWDNSNTWTVGETDGNHYATKTGWDAKSIMTPRLEAVNNEELTFDVLSVGSSFSYAYSTDKSTWSDEVNVTVTGEQTFTAPADGNYYLRFTTRNGRLDNLVGFKLNPLEHDTEIAASSVPETGKQLNVYTATITLKENAGKAEEVTAKLIVNSEEKATKAETLTANGQTVITLTWTPDVVISEAVKAYVTVTGTGIDLQTDEIDLTIAEVYTLDENSSAATVETVSDETIVLKRKFAEGWNTVCLPFDITDVEAFFGEGAVAYNYTGYTDGALNFTKVTELTASYPYIVYVKTAITADMTLNNITIASYNNSGFYRTYNNATFQGTYAPMAAGDMTGKWGVTSAAKIAKGTAEASMKGFRAYFELPGESARLAFFGEDGTTTFIGTISVEDGNVMIYDLNGRRVETMKRGQLYIKNGKKVMNK